MWVVARLMWMAARLMQELKALANGRKARFRIKSVRNPYSRNALPITPRNPMNDSPQIKLYLEDTLECPSGDILEILSEIAEAHHGIGGSMLHTHVVTLEGNGSLIQELIDTTVVRFFAIRKETG